MRIMESCKTVPVERFSLRGIRNRFFADPVVPGVRVINMGSHCNGIYTHIVLPDLSRAKRLDSGSANNISVGQSVYILLTENQTTSYRWVVELSDETVMQGVYDEYISDFNPQGKDGAGGKHRFYFKATGTGACSINMHLSHIGADGETVLEETYPIIVE